MEDLAVVTTPAKLVTIVTTQELQDRIRADLEALGASGYSTARVNGVGKHGVRESNFFEGANVRIESVMSAELAGNVLRRLASAYAGHPLIAFTLDIDALPH